MHTKLEPAALRFMHVYFSSGVWQRSHWRGVLIEKSPLDLMAYQEAIFEVRPDVIIELGTRWGGSAMFFGDMCELVGHGKVVTVDIKQPKIDHPRVTQVEGSTVDGSTLEEIQKHVAGGTAFVTIDDDHTPEHVARELEIYYRFVSPGSYMVVEDSFPRGAPQSYHLDSTPHIRAFLKRRPEFELQPDRYPGGFSMRGWIRRKPTSDILSEMEEVR